MLSLGWRIGIDDLQRRSGRLWVARLIGHKQGRPGCQDLIDLGSEVGRDGESRDHDHRSGAYRFSNPKKLALLQLTHGRIDGSEVLWSWYFVAAFCSKLLSLA